MKKKYQCKFCNKHLTLSKNRPCQYCKPFIDRQKKMEDMDTLHSLVRVQFMDDKTKKPSESAIHDSSGQWYMKIKELSEIKKLMKENDCGAMLNLDGNKLSIILYRR